MYNHVQTKNMNKRITPQLVEQNTANYLNSRSNTILAFLNKGFVIDQSLWEEIEKYNESYALDILSKIPKNYLDERIKLIKIIIYKNPSKLAVLLQETKDDLVVQDKVFQFFEEKRGIKA